MHDADSRPRLLGWRGGTLLLVGVLIGALAISPGVGFAAKALTKQKAQKRYLGNTTIASAPGIAPANDASSATVDCPGDQQAVGGGADGPGVFNGTTVTKLPIMLESKPVGGPRATGWYVEVLGAASDSSTTVEYTVYAVCSP